MPSNKPSKKSPSDTRVKPKFSARHIEVKDSTLVDKVFYDPDNDILDAVFKPVRSDTGTRYRYYDVPPKVFAKFVLAPSMGVFFNEKIRNRFDYDKVEGKGK